MINKHHSHLIFLSILVMSLVIQGCSPKKVEPTPAHQTERPTLVSTKTSFPTATERPTSQPELTKEWTATPISSSTPEPTLPPADNWEGAAFYTAGFLQNWNFFIAVQLNEDIKGSYYAVVGKGKTYYCSNNYNPRRLYCTGPLARLDDWVEYEIFDRVSNQSVFKSKVFIPLDQQNAIPVYKK